MTGSGMSVFSIDRSASIASVTRIVLTASLLSGLWPGVVDDTVTRSVRMLPGTTVGSICSVRLKSRNWPGSSTGITQNDRFVTPGVGVVQVIPGGMLRPMTIDPAGMLALSVTWNAGPGPKLVTRAETVSIPPTGTLAGASNVTPTSA